MSDTYGSCVIVLDNATRNIAKSVSYLELSNYYHIVNDIEELGEQYKGMKVIIFESTILTKAVIPVLRELRYKYDFQFILMYSCDDIYTIANDICYQVRKCDYRIIDINLIYSVIVGDEVIFESYSKIDNSLFSFDTIVQSMSQEASSYLNSMYQTLLDAYIQIGTLTKQNTDLSEICNCYESVFSRIKAGVNDLQRYYDSIDVKAAEYETRLTTVYDKVISGEYNERPIILYFKEFQHIQGMDILLNILYFTLTVQYKRSCKVVKLLDSSNASQARFIPNTYVTMPNVYNLKDLLQHNFILKKGTYDLFFDTLLLNRTRLQFLIVHDMRGCTSLALHEDLIHSSICCATSEYHEMFKDITLLTESKAASKLYWNTKEYSKIPINERLFRLSAHPTVKAIIDSIL